MKRGRDFSERPPKEPQCHPLELEEMVRIVFSFLDDVQDLNSSSNVCRLWSRLASEGDLLWTKRFEEVCLLSPYCHYAHLYSFKSLYEQCLLNKKSLKEVLISWKKKKTLLDKLPHNSSLRGCLHALEWISNNKSRFAGPVYGPIGLELALHHHNGMPLAVYLTHTLKGWFTVFLVQYHDDRDLLTAELCHRHKLAITICRVPGLDELVLRFHRSDKNELAPFGVSHFLDELFDAPPPVKKVLSLLVPVCTTVVGNEQTKDFAKEILGKKTGVETVLTPDGAFTGVGLVPCRAFEPDFVGLLDS